jgi:hypothetical protein
MREMLRTKRKNQMVFTASSSWGPRPRILSCVAGKFNESDFTGLNSGSSSRMTQSEYYHKLGTSRLGLALSGLGSDTFRLWEALTMGTVPVVEKGFGLDKTVSQTNLLNRLCYRFIHSAMAPARPVGGGFRPGDARAAAHGVRGGPVPRRRLRVRAPHAELLVVLHRERVGDDELADRAGQVPAAGRGP